MWKALALPTRRDGWRNWHTDDPGRECDETAEERVKKKRG